jgi:hypothetical protein
VFQLEKGSIRVSLSVQHSGGFAMGFFWLFFAAMALSFHGTVRVKGDERM